MQIPVLPRDLAGRIITSSVSRMGWAVGAVTLVLTVPVLIETLARRDRIDDLPVPLAMLGLMLIGIAFVFGSGRPWAVFLFLAVAGTASVVYDLALILPDPLLLDQAVFLVSRPAVALVTVGVTAVSPLIGVLWATLGYGVSWAVTAVVATVADVPLRPGVGPTLVYGVVVIGYLTLAGIQIAQRRSLPGFRVARGRDPAPGARRGPGAQDDGHGARHRAQRPRARSSTRPSSSSRRARDGCSKIWRRFAARDWLTSTATIQVGNGTMPPWSTTSCA